MSPRADTLERNGQGRLFGADLKPIVPELSVEEILGTLTFGSFSPTSRALVKIPIQRSTRIAAAFEDWNTLCQNLSVLIGEAGNYRDNVFKNCGNIADHLKSPNCGISALQYLIKRRIDTLERGDSVTGPANTVFNSAEFRDLLITLGGNDPVVKAVARGAIRSWEGLHAHLSAIGLEVPNTRRRSYEALAIDMLDAYLPPANASDRHELSPYAASGIEIARSLCQASDNDGHVVISYTSKFMKADLASMLSRESVLGQMRWSSVDYHENSIAPKEQIEAFLQHPGVLVVDRTLLGRALPELRAIGLAPTAPVIFLMKQRDVNMSSYGTQHRLLHLSTEYK